MDSEPMIISPREEGFKETILNPLCYTNMNLLWSGLLVEVLSRLGLRYAVIAPGSRSTPLVVAFATHKKIQAIPILDERSASYFALGLGRQTQQPVVLLCSSGTAAANFFPAIIEASISGVPLLVMTADRPPEMRDNQSRQTIDQGKLYGHYPRWQKELNLPYPSELGLHNLRQTIRYAWERCLFPNKGPVHLNIPFRDPLAPISGNGDNRVHSLESQESLQALSLKIEAILKHVQPTPRTQSYFQDAEAMPKLIEDLKSCNRGLIFVGYSSVEKNEDYAKAIAKIARYLEWPVWIEGLSVLRFFKENNPYLVGHGDWIVRGESWRKRLAPDGILNFGPFPISKVLNEQWPELASCRTWIVHSDANHVDPIHRNAVYIRVSPEVFAEGFPFLSTTSRSMEVKSVLKSDYCKTWLHLEREVDAFLDEKLEGIDCLFEGKIAWKLSQILPEKTPLFVASSTPIRDLAFFGKITDGHYSGYANLGVNGIDGILSTALGVAHENKPTVLLTGDLSFLHDTNGMLIAPEFKGHLTVVLINNSGGRIFQNLPISHWESLCERYWIMPQKVDIQQLVKSYGIDYYRPRNWKDFEALVRDLSGNNMSHDPCCENRVLDHGKIRILEIETDWREDLKIRVELFKEAEACLDLFQQKLN